MSRGGRQTSRFAEGGYARVIASGDQYAGRVGRIIGTDYAASIEWVILDLGSDEVTFQANELEPVGAEVVS